MRLSVLFSLLFISNFFVFAQKKPIAVEQKGDNRLETHFYQSGNDSLKLTISNKEDTLLREYFSEYGDLYLRQWGYDSSYHYQEGVVWSKHFGIKNSSLYALLDVDSIVQFDIKDNYLQRISSRRMNMSREFYPNGLLKSSFSSFLRTNNAPVWRFMESNLWSIKGKLIKKTVADSIIRQTDTLVRYTDSVFYPNGRLMSLVIFMSNVKNSYLGSNGIESLLYRNSKSIPIRCEYYAADGTLISRYPPDSLGVVVFKDNIDCYYGLRNGRGDTVVVPKYDQIVPLDIDVFAAYQGTRCTLHFADGSVLPTPSGLKWAIALTKEMTDSYGYSFATHETSHQLRLYFLVQVEDKIGVLGRDGAYLYPPQYEPLGGVMVNSTSSNTVANYIGDYSLIRFFESRGKDQLSLSVFLLNGKPLSIQNRYDRLNYSGYGDVFVGSKKGITEVLVNSKGIEFGDNQPTTYSLIKGTTLFNVTRLPSVDDTNNRSFTSNLYDVATQRFLLDSNFYVVAKEITRHDTIYKNDGFVKNIKAHYVFAVLDCTRKKMGLIDDKGVWLLPTTYDTLMILDSKSKYVGYRKGAEYGIIKMSDKPTSIYKCDYLLPFESYTSKQSFLVVRRKDKWGMTDLEGTSLIPFDYDYTGLPANGIGKMRVFVKNNQAYEVYGMRLPRLTTHFIFSSYNPNNATTFGFVADDTGKKVFFLDKLGRVKLPPQYQLLQEAGRDKLMLLVDDKGNKKLPIMETGQIYDFPFTDEVVHYDTASQLIVLERRVELDSAQSVLAFQMQMSPYRYGVGSLAGKIIAPFENYGVAMNGGGNGVFFIKTTDFHPKTDDDLRFIYNYTDCLDAFGVNDTSWMMYNKAGRLLNNTPFRTPIVFHEGVGVGAQGNKFGLFRTDGTAIIPPLYTSAFYDDSVRLFVAFDYIGLQPNVVLLDHSGKNRLSKARYNAISDFKGKYALVWQGEKVGLIDTLGREVVAPQDLRTYTSGNLVDSMKLFLRGKKLWDEVRDNEITEGLPISFYYFDNHGHPDSLELSNQLRTSLWHLIVLSLQKHIQNTATALRLAYPEHIFTFIRRSGDNCQKNRSVTNLFASAQYVSFKVGAKDEAFCNFRRVNGRYEDLNALNLWKNDPLSKQNFYDALVKKIRALKDAAIDCSDMNSLLNRAQSQFLATDAGVTVFLNSEAYPSGFDFGNYQPIEFTWAELKPFLK